MGFHLISGFEPSGAYKWKEWVVCFFDLCYLFQDAQIKEKLEVRFYIAI